MTHLSPDELAALAARAAEAAVAAGASARAWFNPGARTSARIEHKPGGSPVTEADFAADSVLRASLAGVRAGGQATGYISEETFVAGDSVAPANGGPFWLVDPIDGTRAFLTGDPQWAVSVALIFGGRPLVGVLHAPALGRTLVAAAGRGARFRVAPLDGQSSTDGPLPALGETAGAPRLAGPKPLVETMAAHFPGATIVPKIPSLALRLAALATGAIDIAIISTGSHCWDLAAGDLILAETGARLAAADGASLRYEQTPLRRGRLAAARAGMIMEVVAALPEEAVLAA